MRSLCALLSLVAAFAQTSCDTFNSQNSALCSDVDAYEPCLSATLNSAATKDVKRAILRSEGFEMLGNDDKNHREIFIKKGKYNFLVLLYDHANNDKIVVIKIQK